MQLSTQTIPLVLKTVRAGRIISALTVLFLLFDNIIKVLALAPVVKAITQFGYIENLLRIT